MLLQVVIATKVFYPTGNGIHVALFIIDYILIFEFEGVNDSGLSRKHIMSSIDTSLKNLGTDYVDLYQIHRWDYNVRYKEKRGNSKRVIIEFRLR